MTTNTFLRSLSAGCKAYAIIALLVLLGQTVQAQSFSSYVTSLDLSATVGSTADGQVSIRAAGKDTVIVHAMIVGTDASAFTLSGTREVLYVGTRDTDMYGTGYFNVTFTASAERAYSATLILTDSVNTVTQIPLKGTGYITPLGIDSAYYASTFLGDTSCATVKFYNPNTSGNMVVTALSLAGGSNSAFTYKLLGGATLPVTLAPRDVLYVQVCFKPTVKGMTTDSLFVRYTNVNGKSQVARSSLTGYADYNYNACVHIEGDSNYLGPVAINTSQIRSIHLRNDQTNSITVSYTATDNTHFSIVSPTFPLTIASGTASDVKIKFTPGSTYVQGEFDNTIIFTADNGQNSCTHSLSLRAYVSKPSNTIDTTLLLLAPDSTETVNITASDRNSYQIVKVYNNTGVNEKIVQVFMQIGRFFTATIISPDSTLPFILPAGQTMLVQIALIDTMQTTYYDTLVIVTQHGLVSFKYPVHAKRVVQDVSMSLNAEGSLRLNPNPSHGSVTLHLGALKNAEVQVLDLLGRVITSQNVSGSRWTWNGMNSAGDIAPTGTYIIRVTVHNASGAVTTLSSRLVLSR